MGSIRKKCNCPEFEAILDNGGTVTFFPHKNVSIDFSGQKMTDDVRASIEKLNSDLVKHGTSVVFLDLSNTSLSNSDMELIQTLGNIQGLNVDGSKFDNFNIDKLAKISSLLYLSCLRCDGISEKQLVKLAEDSRLIRVDSRDLSSDATKEIEVALERNSIERLRVPESDLERLFFMNFGKTLFEKNESKGEQLGTPTNPETQNRE